MSQRGEALARGVESCKNLLGRYLAGFTDETRTAQPPGLPNHVAWSLGHLALTMHRIREKFGEAPPGAPDFGAGGFDPESVAFGSVPRADSSSYPPLSRCIEVYDRACDQLATAVRDASDESLDRKIPWGPVEITLEAAVSRMVFHNGMHTGQIADTRRALGMKSIFA